MVVVARRQANLLIRQISNATWSGYPRKMKIHGIPKSNVVLLPKAARGVDLKGCFLLLLAPQPSHKDWLSSGDSRRDDGKKITLDQSERGVGQTERFTARWLVHDFVAILVVRRAARGTARNCSGAAGAALGRLQLTCPRGCCYCCWCCYTGARAGALVCCCCHRRSRLTIQMARPPKQQRVGDETTHAILLLLYVALAPGLDFSDYTQIHAVFTNFYV